MSRPCQLCIRAEETGYLEVSHCDVCHRTWDSLEEEHCNGCHQHFGSDRAFLDHRRDGKCIPPERLTRNGRPKLKAVSRRYGIVWVQNDERDFPQKPVSAVGSRLGDANGCRAGTRHLQRAGSS